MSLDSIVAQISIQLSITPFDVYIFFGVLVSVGIMAIMGLSKIYSIFFGSVLGIGIFVLFSTILSPELQTPETLSIISEAFAKALIGSSVYLIFILAVLVPINGGVSLSLPKTALGKMFQTIVISSVLILFLTAIFLWLAEKNYIFRHTDSVFTLLKSLTVYGELRNSLFFAFIASHIPTIIILSIGFIIYKMLFSDIVNTLFASIWGSIKKRKSGKQEEHNEGWHDNHDEHNEGWHDNHGWWHGHH